MVLTFIVKDYRVITISLSSYKLNSYLVGKKEERCIAEIAAKRFKRM
jgi:hypothetical protein